jgi:hypothetical protein
MARQKWTALHRFAHGGSLGTSTSSSIFCGVSVLLLK